MTKKAKAGDDDIDWLFDLPPQTLKIGRSRQFERESLAACRT